MATTDGMQVSLKVGESKTVTGKEWNQTFGLHSKPRKYIVERTGEYDVKISIARRSRNEIG